MAFPLYAAFNRKLESSAGNFILSPLCSQHLVLRWTWCLEYRQTLCCWWQHRAKGTDTGHSCAYAIMYRKLHLRRFTPATRFSSWLWRRSQVEVAEGILWNPMSTVFSPPNSQPKHPPSYSHKRMNSTNDFHRLRSKILSLPLEENTTQVIPGIKISESPNRESRWAAPDLWHRNWEIV